MVTEHGLLMLQMCQKYDVKNFVFSSSATVYGVPKELPVTENSPTGQVSCSTRLPVDLIFILAFARCIFFCQGITNPYGQTKYMMEQILIDVGKAHPVRRSFKITFSGRIS